MELFFASLALSRLAQILSSSRKPTCCPYCPHLGCHWIKWASYERHGEDLTSTILIRVQRYRCKITGRTFSLLPDALLPFRHPTTATILRWLFELFIRGRGTAAVAQATCVPRITIRRIRAEFLDAVKILRLPGSDGSLAPSDFIARLAELGVDAVANLFATWKEHEPKLSIVGVYPR